jgi:hypothetical protein
LVASLLAVNYWASWRLIKKARAANPPDRIDIIIVRDAFLTVLLLVMMIPMPTVMKVIGGIALVGLLAVQILLTYRIVRAHRD